MTRDDLFKINAGIVRDLVQGVADNCPKAYVLVISNPVNSTVPIAAEVLKNAGVFDPKKLFGVTTLDVVRAETFIQEITGTKDPAKTNIPVIGGHSGETIVPLFSKAQPPVNVPSDKLDALVHRKSFVRAFVKVVLVSNKCTVKASNLVETKLSRLRTALVRPRSRWHMQASGKFPVSFFLFDPKFDSQKD